MRTLEAEAIQPMGLLPPKSPPPPKDIGRSVYLPPELWDELTSVAEESKDDDPLGEGYTRNEVIQLALRDWLDRNAKEKKSRKR